MISDLGFMIWDFRFGIYDLWFSDLGIKHGVQLWNTEVTEDTEDCDLWLKIFDVGFMMVECWLTTDLNEATKKQQ